MHTKKLNEVYEALVFYLPSVKELSSKCLLKCIGMCACKCMEMFSSKHSKANFVRYDV